MALAKHAGRFVWLSVDTEKDENSAFLAKFPVGVLPTLLVVDAEREQAALTRAASVTVTELVRLLDDGEAAVRHSASNPAGAALADGERLAGEGRPKEAAAAFRRALELGGPGWSRRGRVVESLAGALSSTGEVEACATLVAAEAPSWARDPLFVSVVTTGLYCAVEGPEAAPWRAGALAALEPLAKEALGLRDLIADDRSGVYEMLIEAREAAHDSDGKRQLAGAWLAFLEGEAARAPTPEARAAFDAHRLAASLALGDPARAVTALRASERDLPADYNAPARLATAYLELGRTDEALAAAERALTKVYGPRRLRVEETRVKIYLKKGDLAAARRALDEAIRFGESLPAVERTRKTLERLRAQRQKL